MNIKQVAVALLIAVGAAAGTAHAAIETKGVPTFKDNKKEIDYWNVKFFKGAKRIIVPTATVKLVVSGEVGAFVQRGGNSAKAKSKYVVSGIDKEFAQAMAKKVQDDVITQFRAAGWEVLSYDDIKAEKDVVEEDRLKVDAAWQMPVDKNAGNLFVVANPTDEQNFKMDKIHWNLRKIAKERDAVIYAPTYTFIAPQFWAETSRGYKSSSVQVNSAPGVTLMPAGIYAIFLNHKGAGGAFKNNEQYVHLADDAGVISEATDKSPEFANALSKTLAALGGGGYIDSKVGFYGYTLNREKFEAGVLGTITNFNTAVAAETAEYRKN